MKEYFWREGVGVKSENTEGEPDNTGGLLAPAILHLDWNKRARTRGLQP